MAISSPEKSSGEQEANAETFKEERPLEKLTQPTKPTPPLSVEQKLSNLKTDIKSLRSSFRSVHDKFYDPRPKHPQYKISPYTAKYDLIESTVTEAISTLSSQESLIEEIEESIIRQQELIDIIAKLGNDHEARIENYSQLEEKISSLQVERINSAEKIAELDTRLSQIEEVRTEIINRTLYLDFTKSAQEEMGLLSGDLKDFDIDKDDLEKRSGGKIFWSQYKRLIPDFEKLAGVVKFFKRLAFSAGLLKGSRPEELLLPKIKNIHGKALELDKAQRELLERKREQQVLLTLQDLILAELQDEIVGAGDTFFIPESEGELRIQFRKLSMEQLGILIDKAWQNVGSSELNTRVVRNLYAYSPEDENKREKYRQLSGEKLFQQDAQDLARFFGIELEEKNSKQFESIYGKFRMQYDRDGYSSQLMKSLRLSFEIAKFFPYYVEYYLETVEDTQVQETCELILSAVRREPQNKQIAQALFQELVNVNLTPQEVKGLLDIYSDGYFIDQWNNTRTVKIKDWSMEYLKKLSEKGNLPQGKEGVVLLKLLRAFRLIGKSDWSDLLDSLRGRRVDLTEENLDFLTSPDLVSVLEIYPEEDNHNRMWLAIHLMTSNQRATLTQELLHSSDSLKFIPGIFRYADWSGVEDFIIWLGSDDSLQLKDIFNEKPLLLGRLWQQLASNKNLEQIIPLLENQGVMKQIADQPAKFDTISHAVEQNGSEIVNLYLEYFNYLASNELAFLRYWYLAGEKGVIDGLAVLGQQDEAAIITFLEKTDYYQLPKKASDPEALAVLFDVYKNELQNADLKFDGEDLSKEVANLFFEITSKKKELKELIKTAQILKSIGKMIKEPGVQQAFRSSIDQFLATSLETTSEYIQVTRKILTSPSQEIVRLKDQLVMQVLSVPDPVAAYEQIEDIFIKNNLPLVGKINQVFAVLHPAKDLAAKVRSRRFISPVLVSTATEATRLRRSIIYRDLLKVHIESGNRSLRNYLETMQSAQNIFDTLDESGDAQITLDQQEELHHALDKLETLYENSLLASIRQDPTHLAQEPDLAARYYQLKQLLQVGEGQKLTDRIAEMFIKPLGYENFDQVLERMDLARLEADTRNRGNLATRSGEKGIEYYIQLDHRDLLKGLEVKFLDASLNNGIVAREFLGAFADSDSTPLDTDTSRISEADAALSTKEIIGSSIAIGYGGEGVILHIRDRGQFQETRAGEAVQYDRKHYEIFATPVQGERHYGIRTGISSSEIDSIFINPAVIDEKGQYKIFFEVAKNGFYVPVADYTGRVLLTPEKYDELRRTFDGVEEYDGARIEFSPTQTSDQHFSEVSRIMDNFQAGREQVATLTTDIRSTLKTILAEYSIELKSEFDSSLIGAEFDDTGSTGRGANDTSSFDFDFALKLDAADMEKVGQIQTQLLKLIECSKVPEVRPDQIRIFGASKIGDVDLDALVDIDIAFASKSELAYFDSHDSLTEKYASIRRTYGEEAYQQTLANVILTKQILRAGNAYKKQEHGGFGGIGVENWILANQGNMLKAFQSFRDAAYDGDRRLPLEDFREKYRLLDAGINLKFGRHDNFIKILKPAGYEAMLDTIEAYLG